MNEQIESMEIKLPVEIENHLCMGAKELCRAELAYIRCFYGDDLESVDFQMMTQLLAHVMIGKLDSIFDEVVEELDE